eukprot:Gb_06824 [translate_table: standard]
MCGASILPNFVSKSIFHRNFFLCCSNRLQDRIPATTHTPRCSLCGPFFVFAEGKFARLLRFQCPTTLLQSSRGYSGSRVEQRCFKVHAVAQVPVSSKQMTIQRSFILLACSQQCITAGFPLLSFECGTTLLQQTDDTYLCSSALPSYTTHDFFTVRCTQPHNSLQPTFFHIDAFFHCSTHIQHFKE